MTIMEIIREAEGGMKEHFMTLVKGLAQEGVEVTALCHFPEAETKELEICGIKVIPYSFPKKLFPMLGALVKICKLLQKSRPDLIHCHGFQAGFLGRLAGWLTGIPSVYTVHNFVTFGRGEWVSGWIQRFERWMGKKTAKTICVSRALKTTMVQEINIPEEKLHVVYNAVPTLPAGDRAAIRSIHNLTDEDWVIGTAARLIPSKGIPILLTAVSCSLAKYPNIKVLIAGSGPEETNLRMLSRSLGIAGQTIFAGKVSNIHDYYAAFDCFVLPTLSEGLGITVLEAMSFGLPIIASAVGGIPEVLDHERNGILVPPNHTFALRTALQTLLEDPEQGAVYGQQAKLDIQKGLTEKEMVKQTWSVLKEAMSAD